MTQPWQVLPLTPERWPDLEAARSTNQSRGPGRVGARITRAVAVDAHFRTDGVGYRSQLRVRSFTTVRAKPYPLESCGAEHWC